MNNIFDAFHCKFCAEVLNLSIAKCTKLGRIPGNNERQQ